MKGDTMKTLFILFALLMVGCTASAQQLSERDAIDKDHIDLTKETVYFTIHGLVEVDGHTFINDTSANPFMFFANVDGIKITRKGLDGEYRHRVCTIKGCPILHLELIQAIQFTPPTNQWWNIAPIQLNEDHIGVDLGY